ncbi:MAG TPA: ATPase domain-containing protein [Methanoregulaceae archaeon]|nr:MAG: flagellar accessory protein FlaH [Methanolinea sp.]HON82420.1 ATPase domain-containing protein [Methanoregulaceae archaeon]HPD11349.1 ATPase domain-containing protein [Methanoregulaceae archaeon]HRU31759.1 ATPase domain-containing protein [Methanoregulaceae archaeon]
MSKNEITGILGGEDKNILSTGNSEIDKKIADGLPLGSLTLIEGENDTGKSVLTQQIIWGAMKQGLNVDIFSTEMTTKSFLSQMESMSLDVSDYFAWGYVRLFPIHAADLSWSEEQMEGILDHVINHIRKSRAEVHIIDSLTMFTKYSSQAAILTFLTNCKTLVDKGKTILITLHNYAFEEDTLIRIRSICDAHLMMKKSLIGDKYVMVMEVVKVRGARKTTGNLVSFEVHPGYGMKIIPISMARV